MSYNKIILIGNLGRDPELRYTPSGLAVCDFSVATNEKKKDGNGEFQDITTWFKITLWGDKAENASKYLEKGRQVYIEGRIRLSEWTDRDNNTRQTLEVTASEMQFLSDGNRSSNMPGNSDDSDNDPGNASDNASDNDFGDSVDSKSSAGNSAATVEVPADDDIPF